MDELTGDLIGELILGELPEWHSGVCRVQYDEKNEDIVVHGENDHVVRRIDIAEYSHYDPNLTEIADVANDAIKSEQAEL